MEVVNLIEMGEKLKEKVQSGSMGKYVPMQDFSKWAGMCIMYLESKYPNSTLTKRFVDKVNGKSSRLSLVEELLGYLEGISEYDK